jgi:hypothetical protein
VTRCSNVNNDGVINDDDRVAARINAGGFQRPQLGTVRERRLLQFAGGNDLQRRAANDGGYYYDIKFKRALSRWQQPGVTNEPRASFDGTSGAD